MAKQEWAVTFSIQAETGLAKVALIAVLQFLGCNVSTEQEIFPPAQQELVPFEVTTTLLPLADLAAAQPINSSIQIRFSDFPDPTTLNFPALQFGPRGQNIQYTVEVSLVDKQITLRPRVHLLPQTDYGVALYPSIRSLLGRPLGSSETDGNSAGVPFFLRFHTGAQLQPEAPPSPPVHLADLLTAEGPLRQSCAHSGCHANSDSHGPARGLDFSAPTSVVQQALVGGRRAGSDFLLLVSPGQPEMSYLLRKLLAASSDGFLRINGDPMPPPPSSPLNSEALSRIETWIRNGAQ